jgi:cation diffusion facilitator family transporter
MGSGRDDVAGATPAGGKDEQALALSVWVYLVVMLVKLGAWWWTGVMALLAEGLHTLSDVLVSGFLLLAARQSRRKPDALHPFGYGRSQYVAALVAAVLFISFTAFELYREGLGRLLGHEASQPARDLAVALGVLGAAMLAGAWPLVALWRNPARGAAARAQLLELVNDELGLLAALVGTALVAWGVPLADPVSALVVASIILLNGVALFRENLSYVLGRAPPDEVTARLQTLALAVPGVRGVHRLRAEQLAPDSLHVELHVEVARGLPIEAANDVAEEVIRVLATSSAGPHYVSVHVDPERPGELRPPTASA